MEIKKKLPNFRYMRTESIMMQGLYDLIEYINEISPTKKMKMVEIGSYLGESTLVFADHFKEVITIDPFLDDYDPNDEACKHVSLSVVHEQFLLNIEGKNNIKHIHKLSDDAIEDLKTQSFDFIYIDGLHTYDQIKKDIENYLPLIKKGGFIAGHDYHPNHQGVIDGIDEMLKIDQTFSDTSWIKRV